MKDFTSAITVTLKQKEYTQIRTNRIKNFNWK